MNLSLNQKKELLKLKQHTQIVAEFFPKDFYSIKDYNLNLTKENILKPTGNLKRNYENVISIDNFPKIELDKFLYYYQMRKYKICFELGLTYLTSFINFIDSKSIYSTNVKEKVNQMFYDKIISYTVYSNSMKILEIVDNQVSYYLKETEFDDYKYYKNSESVYIKKLEKKSEANVKYEIQNLIKNLVEMLYSYNSKHYQYLVIKYDELIYEFV